MTIDQATLGKRLRDARNNRGISQEEAAEKLGVPRTALVHLEAGNRSISTLELVELAGLYQRPIIDFFRETEEPPEEDLLLAVHRVAPDFRDDPQVNQEISRHVELCRLGAELQNLLALSPRNSPPSYELPTPTTAYEAVRNGAHVANQERKRLGLGDNPISDLADLIASQGLWASGADFPNGMSGMFLRHSSIGMVILVNYEHPRARKRFSYAHEYAHALLDRDLSVTVTTEGNRSDLIEVRANAFAAAFLMPEDGVAAFLLKRDKGQGTRESMPVYDILTERGGPEVEAQWRSAPRSQRITCQLVAMTAHHFGVSYQAACYRLKTLRYVNKEELQRLLDQEQMGLAFLEMLRMKQDLEGKDDRQTLDRELLREVVNLAIEAYGRGEISKGKLLDIASILKIPSKELLKFAETCGS